MIILPIIILVISTVGLKSFGTIEHIWEVGPLDYVVYYREVAHDTRATYGVILDTSSPFTIAYTSLLVVTHYLFKPYVWEVDGWLDLYASFEGLFRMLLVVGSLLLWQSSNKSLRSKRRFLIVIYFFITLIWAYGTTNYGTSIRHNLVHYWIIVILGTPFISSLVTNFFQVKRIRQMN